MSMIFFDLDSRVFFFQQFSNIYSHAGIKYQVYICIGIPTGNVVVVSANDKRCLSAWKTYECGN